MTKEEAQCEAEKREKNKSKYLSHKHWSAVHNSAKGWHVTLVDNQRYLQQEALKKGRAAFQAGDLNGFMEAASASMMAGVRAEIAEYEDKHPDSPLLEKREE